VRKSIGIRILYRFDCDCLRGARDDLVLFVPGPLLTGPRAVTLIVCTAYGAAHEVSACAPDVRVSNRIASAFASSI